jgi:hypothetical protein
MLLFWSLDYRSNDSNSTPLGISLFYYIMLRSFEIPNLRPQDGRSAPRATPLMNVSASDAPPDPAPTPADWAPFFVFIYFFNFGTLVGSTWSENFLALPMETLRLETFDTSNGDIVISLYLSFIIQITV